MIRAGNGDHHDVEIALAMCQAAQCQKRHHGAIVREAGLSREPPAQSPPHYLDNDLEAQAWVAAFYQGLQKLGWVEGTAAQSMSASLRRATDCCVAANWRDVPKAFNCVAR